MASENNFASAFDSPDKNRYLLQQAVLCPQFKFHALTSTGPGVLRLGCP